MISGRIFNVSGKMPAGAPRFCHITEIKSNGSQQLLLLRIGVADQQAEGSAAAVDRNDR